MSETFSSFPRPSRQVKSTQQLNWGSRHALPACRKPVYSGEDHEENTSWYCHLFCLLKTNINGLLRHLIFRHSSWGYDNYVWQQVSLYNTLWIFRCLYLSLSGRHKALWDVAGHYTGEKGREYCNTPSQRYECRSEPWVSGHQRTGWTVDCGGNPSTVIPVQNYYLYLLVSAAAAFTSPKDFTSPPLILMLLFIHSDLFKISKRNIINFKVFEMRIYLTKHTALYCHQCIYHIEPD